METAKDVLLKRREADGGSGSGEESARATKKQRLEPTADTTEIICSLFDTCFLLDASRLLTNQLATLLVKAEVGETRTQEFAKNAIVRLGKMEAALVEASGQTEQKGEEGSVGFDLGKLREYVKEARGLGVLVAEQISEAEKKAGAEAMGEVGTLRDDMVKFGSGELSKKSLKIADSIKKPASEDVPAGDETSDMWLAELINCNLTSVQNVQDGISQVQHIAVSHYAPPKAAPANLLRAAPAAAKAPSKAPAAVESVPAVNQKVYFVTNRKFVAKDGSYGKDDQNTEEYGNTTVKIPQFVEGKMRKEGDRNYTVTANDIQRKSFDDFIKDINTDLAPSPSKEILLFIHGYNVEYNEAMGALAGLALDIDFKGPAIALDWASNGSLALYGFTPLREDDKERVKSGAPLFSNVLKQLTNSITGLNKVHILAHSMGNLLLDRMLENLEKTSTPPDNNPFRFVHTVILAAADISPQEGRNSLKRISTIPPPNKSGKRAIAIYCSAGDAALAASTAIQVRDGARVGYLMNRPFGRNHFFHPFYAEGSLAETVEVKNTGLDAVGHSYYSYDREVLGDIKKLIEAEGKGNVRTKTAKCTANPLCIPRLWSLPEVRKS